MIRQRIKQPLALLLTIVMLLGLLPTTAFAVSVPNSTWVDTKIEQFVQNGYTKGDWFQISGSHVYWCGLTRLVNTGAGITTDTILFIAPGEDATDCAIPDYEALPALWSQSNASQIYIADGITGIGNHAFDSMPTLKKMEIENPSALTRVGEYAFRGCENLTYSAENPLDLSGVTDLGEYAFYTCEKLKYIKLNGSLDTILEYAFYGCGLSEIEIPASVKEIQEGAFAINAFTEQGHLVLPEGLETIGDSAFAWVHTVGGGNGGFTALTIPSTVTTIGKRAFYGHMNLAEVTVNATAPRLQKPGAAAFGTSPNDGAYSKIEDIIDPISGITYHNVNIGTKFYTKDDATAALFINEDNCFLGDLTPLRYVDTEPATCTEDGYNLYSMTLNNVSSGGQPVTVETKVVIPAVGHDYEDAPDKEATCENPGYKVQVCTNEEKNLVPEEGCNAPEKLEEIPGKPALGHQYVVGENGVTNPAISKENSGKGDTVVTYTCAHYSQDSKENKHDSNGVFASSYNWSIKPTTLTASTSHSLDDLTLPVVTGSGSGSAELVWADDVNTETLLTAGTLTYPVKLVIKGTQNTFPEYADKNFTIAVQVDKVKLDFSKVAFQNATRYTGLNNPDFAVTGLPEGVTQARIEYKLKEGDEWSTNQPAETDPNDAANYEVRVTYSYNGSKYLLDTTTSSLQPSEAYKLAPGTDDNTVTITGDYIVRALTADDLKAESISGLVYNGNGQATIRISGIPTGAKVTASWTEGDTPKTEIIENATQASYDVAKITNAGTYNVNIKVEHSTAFANGFVELTAKGTIAKQTVTTPTANTLQPYTPGTVQTGVPDSTNADIYTVTDNKQTNAGTYTAAVALADTNNYCWSTGDENSDGKVEITYTIPKRALTKPDILTAMRSSEFNRNAKEALSNPSPDLLTYTYDADGTVSAVWKDQTDVAYTATNAKKTDAGEYMVEVKLADDNYQWFDETENEYTLTWKITQKQITAPKVTAEDAVYTGAAYAAENISLADDSEDLLTLGADHQYYTSQIASDAMKSAPVNAGTYWVLADLAFPANENEDNYQIIGNNRIQFKINPVTATLTFKDSSVIASYTVAGTKLQEATVSGLVEADENKTDAYSISYQYKYKATAEADDPAEWTTIDNPTTFTFRNVGIYEIRATLTGKNYTADPAAYTLTIVSNTQSVKLSSEDTAFQDNSITKTLGDAPFTVTGKGQVAGADTGAHITYTSSDESIASVDQNGQVTIHKAATTPPVTITVTAAGGSNYSEASATYTVTVNKGTPAIALTSQEITASYTGLPLADSVYRVAAVSSAENGAVDPTGNPSYTFYMDEQCKNKVTNGGGTENNVPIAVGTYYMKVTYPGDDNYNEAEAKTVKVTITAGGLSVAATGHTAVYDGQPHDAITVTKVTGSAGEINAEDYAVQYAVTNTDTAPAANDGGWKDELKVKDVADSTDADTFYWYKVTADNHAPKIGQVEVSISPAEVTVVGIPKSFTKSYDGNANVTTNLEAVSVKTSVSSESITKLSVTGTYADKNAGTNKDVTLTLTLSGTKTWGNYAYNGTALTNGIITLLQENAGAITAKEITVTGGITAENRVYDGTNAIKLNGTPTTNGIAMNDSLTLSLKEDASGTVESADVGTSKAVTVNTNVITLSGVDKDNYTVTEISANLTVNITKRPVQLAFVGAVEGTITKSFTGSPINVAVYAIATSTEGEGFVATDSLKDDDVVYTYTGTDENHTAVGEYTVTASLKETAEKTYGNYELKFPTQVTLKITPAGDLTVTAKDYTADYTGNPHNVTEQWGFTGYTSTDGRTVQFIQKEEGQTKNPGKSETWETITFENVTQSGEYWYCVTAPNHNTVYGDTPVTITINPRPLTVAPTLNVTKTYDGTNTFNVEQISKTDVTGTVTNETVTATATSAVYENATAGTGKTIHITYTLSGAGLSNYTYNGAVITDRAVRVTVQNGVITPKEITVTINDKSKTYDGSAPSVTSVKGSDWTVHDADLCDIDDDGTKDELGVTLSVKDSAAQVGSYTITGTAGNSNYDVTFTSGTFTVNPRHITLTIGNAVGIYGDAPDKNSVSLTDSSTGENTGLVSGEDINQFLTLVTIGADEKTAVGTRQITGTDSACGNYQVTFANSGTYTISQRPITITLQDSSSKYGCEITKLTWKDAYTGDSSKQGVVGGDDLGITLNTTATSASPVASYPITGVAQGEAAENYGITWVGETAYNDQSAQATYTIDKAQLEIEYSTNPYSVAMGGSVDNPLVFTNGDSHAKLTNKPNDVTVTYASVNTDVATVDEQGNVVVVGVGTATITATITAYGANYEQRAASETASYTLNVVQGGAGIQVNVQPKVLTYTGDPQELVTTTVTSPRGVTVTYSLNDSDASTKIPTGTDAGGYTVNWTASASGYTSVSGTTYVEIRKANPSTGFSPVTVQTEYAEGKVFDATKNTTLNIHEKYKSESGQSIEYASNNTRVAEILTNTLEAIQLNSVGSAKISAVFGETKNFNSQTVSFTLTVSQAGTTIQYTAENYNTGYDGRPHGSDIKVTSPTHYTIMYSDDGGTTYKLKESPTITDVKNSPLTIYFQIQADGYPSQEGTQTVTLNPKQLNDGMVSGIAASYTYTGQQITPAASVHDGRTLLVKDTDYTVAYGTNTAVGSGTVTIKGAGNYTGEVTKSFSITNMEGSYLSAELDRYFGYYGDDETNSATVTVRYGDEKVGAEDITLSVSYTDGTESVENAIEEGLATNKDQTLTFNKAGIYTITVEVAGSYDREEPFTLSYTLLPENTSSDEFTITGAEETIVTYDGENHAFEVTVTDEEDTPLTEGTDYALTYSYTPFVGEAVEGNYSSDDTKMVEAGLYIVTVTGSDNYSGEATIPFLIAQRSLSDTEVKATLTGNLTYSGSAQKPTVTLKLDDNTITNLEETQYHNNVNAGQGLAVSTASESNNNFTGTRADSFVITPKNIADSTVTVNEIPKQPYTGKPVTPTVTITDSERDDAVLVQGADYTVTASNDGTPSNNAEAIIQGTGNYTGTKSVTFAIDSESEPPPANKFTLSVKPDTTWIYGSAPENLTLSVRFGTRELSFGTDYTLTVNDVTYNAPGTSLDNVLAAIKALKPGNYTVTAQGVGVYSSSSAQAEIKISKAELPLQINVNPSLTTGSGTAEIQITGFDKWPAHIDRTKLTTLTVKKNGVDQSGVKLEYDNGTKTYKAVSFSFPNETANYIFGIDVSQILGFDPDCYNLALTGGTLQVVKKNSDGGNGGTTHYIIEAEASSGGGISPDGRVQVNRGNDQTFRILPDKYYQIADVIVDGKSVGAVNSYTFEDVRKNHTITAQFVKSDTPSIPDPEETGVSDWLNTTDHIAFLHGYGKDKFGPDDNMTRAQAAQMFYNLLLDKDVAITVSFIDVPADAWYAKAVNTLGSLRIIAGVGNDTFDPNRAITRAEFSAIATRFAHLSTSHNNPFPDVAEDNWYYRYVMSAVEYGWIGGYPDGTFRPGNTITRAEVTALVNRMLGRNADRSYIDMYASELQQFNDLSKSHWAYYPIMEASNSHDYTKSNGVEHWKT